MTDAMWDADGQRAAEISRLNKAFQRRLIPVSACSGALAIVLIMCSSLGPHSQKQHFFIAALGVMVAGAAIFWLMLLRFSRQVKALRATQYSQY